MARIYLASGKIWLIAGTSWKLSNIFSIIISIPSPKELIMKTDGISPKKLENDVYENNGDFMDQAMENGNLLNYVHTNFKLERDYLFAYEDKDPTPFYFFFIISSKINKCFYILLFFQDIELGYQVDYCIKKVKNKDLAIKFVKEEQKKLEKNKFYISKV